MAKGSPQDPDPAAEKVATTAEASGANSSPCEAVVASHDVLFLAPTEKRCDACHGVLPEGGDDDGFDPPGEGVYLWARGNEVRFERAPLCASCASAIGMTALARWEIEEEEG